MLNFFNTGIQNCGVIYKNRDCKSLLKEINNLRNFKNIFLSQKEYLSGSKSYLKKNPAPGRNLLHKLNCSFIFENKKFKKEMTKILGINYRILDSKLVMGVPDKFLPKWIKEEIKDNMTNNLGIFIKPEYRDITYFKGIDFHQDIIDFPTRKADFITAYIYLENVNKNTSPLYLIPNSYKFGATIFPHNLKTNKKIVLYKNKNKKMISKIKMLIGKPGSMSYWHPFILHGTQPQLNSIPRISVRLLVEKNRYLNINCGLDKINRKIKGDMYLNLTQKEFNSKGKVIKKGNKINKL